MPLDILKVASHFNAKDGWMNEADVMRRLAQITQTPRGDAAMLRGVIGGLLAHKLFEMEPGTGQPYTGAGARLRRTDHDGRGFTGEPPRRTWEAIYDEYDRIVEIEAGEKAEAFKKQVNRRRNGRLIAALRQALKEQDAEDAANAG